MRIIKLPLSKFSSIWLLSLIATLSIFTNQFSITKKIQTNNTPLASSIQLINTFGDSTKTAYAGTVENLPCAPGTYTWASTSSGTGTPNGNGVRIVAMPDNGISECVRFSNFSFDLPCNANITGVKAFVTQRNAISGDLYDYAVHLILADGSLSATNLASPVMWFESSSNSSYDTKEYNGGLWGETLTPAIVESSSFGLSIQVEGNDPGTTVSFPIIDAVQLEICYNIPEGIAKNEVNINANYTQVSACSATDGSITINATGDGGPYEYSKDGGINWQSSPIFIGLPPDNYHLLARYATGAGCRSLPLFIVLDASPTILQPGDALVSCKGSPTLEIKKIQPANTLYQQGDLGTDVSTYLPNPNTTKYSWNTSDFGGQEIFSTAIDSNWNIYATTSKLYNILKTNVPVAVYKIDATTGNSSLLSTLAGDAGAGGIGYDSTHHQLFVANMSDGIIYRLNINDGTTLSSFNPLGADDGNPDWAPLGERVLAVAYNPTDNRLYYSIWANDAVNNGNPNTIRSVALNTNGEFLPITDQIEITLPVLPSLTYSMPVTDIAFNQVGNSLLLAESGFDSSVPLTQAHRARVLKYDGMSNAWGIDNSLPTGNTMFKYEIGALNNGSNARGGVAWGYGLYDATGTTQAESFIVATADALRGTSCAGLPGCIYGLQYLPSGGSRPTNSVLIDLDRNLSNQEKSIFGDVDIVLGGCSVPPCIVEISSRDTAICPSYPVDLSTLVDGQTGSLSYSLSLNNWGSINNLVSPITTTDYYVRDSDLVTTCVDTTLIKVQVLPCDYGDLPDTSVNFNPSDYQTLVANNGPVHIIDNNLKLGATIDGEMNGQPNSAANGDGEDEDGLHFPASLNITTNGTLRLPLSVTNNTEQTAHLEAWIDWNGDGDFLDDHEQVANLNDSSGFPSYLMINIPSALSEGIQLGFRVRLSHTDNMTPYGLVNTGEVEDYLLEVNCATNYCLPIDVEVRRE